MAASEETVENRGPFVWCAVLPRPMGKWVEFDKLQFKTANLDDSLSIRIRDTERTCGNYNLDVSVRRSSATPIKADVTIWFSGVGDGQKITNKLDKWEEACDFFHALRGKWFSHSFSIYCEVDCRRRSGKSLPPLDISQHIAGLCTNPLLSDITLVVNGEEIFAHKVVLGVHSMVFRTIFETPTVEVVEGKINIKDVKTDVMLTVLRILYMGNTKPLENPATAVGVLPIAEKYGMDKLKDLCEHTLSASLTVDNALDIYGLACDNGATALRADCRRFIRSHRREIFHGDNFRKFCLSRPHLMQDVVVKLVAD